MFGYVTPCKMELKIKDYEIFKAYYCGVCKSIKSNYGNIPRISLNYDMTFLAILIDAFLDEPLELNPECCPVHPLKKRLSVRNNSSVDYASKLNITLTHYKFLDDLNDEKAFKYKILYSISNLYIKKNPLYLKDVENQIKTSLEKLSNQEKDIAENNIDSISDTFADLTGILLTSYNFKDKSFIEDLYWLGYNLGKWIYLIDAIDDLKDDMKNNKFNPINHCFNENNLEFLEFYSLIKDRVEFILVYCASQCLDIFYKLPIKKNKDLIENILKYGLMEKMDKVFYPEKYNKDNIYINLKKEV
ncbi:DUF5685 family protein [Clostridium algidicarnis]|uniref:DUF5685 family protein n=1 Tax=Clostridium algidicarnis TaxID=37659 RepID=UPI001C0E55BF|nr:DUF5685 family protein [Clostridium algidicarnis]MBU3196126.1 hypothetical protein [Clostridium algidicarnis]MBU3209168.1 hypothetical protein [Clostridium algidicarnis]MBU3229140.1 hypothetical protein [Clostridium algidicarnis]MBU3252654.1 hypothetical protein [Clostridium algidicarnis]